MKIQNDLSRQAVELTHRLAADGIGVVFHTPYRPLNKGADERKTPGKNGLVAAPVKTGKKQPL